MTTKYLDLDAVSSDIEFTIKLDGKDHVLKEATVESFLSNVKSLEKLSLNASPAEELELTLKMILKSFPTITDAQLRALTFTKLQKIREFAMTAGGEETEKATAEGETAENPKKAN